MIGDLMLNDRAAEFFVAFQAVLAGPALAALLVAFRFRTGSRSRAAL